MANQMKLQFIKRLACLVGSRGGNIRGIYLSDVNSQIDGGFLHFVSTVVVALVLSAAISQTHLERRSRS